MYQTENLMNEIYDGKATLPKQWDPVTSTTIKRSGRVPVSYKIPCVEFFCDPGYYDNAQEYLLKQWLLTAKSDLQSLALCSYVK